MENVILAYYQVSLLLHISSLFQRLMALVGMFVEGTRMEFRAWSVPKERGILASALRFARRAKPLRTRFRP